MLLDEKKNLEQQDISNNENDFKELDNEITKVIRVETSLDEEKNEKKNIDNNISNLSHNLNEVNNDKKDNSNIINQNFNNNNNIIIKNNIIDEEGMLKKMISKNRAFKNESKDLNKYPNNLISSLIYNQREQLNNNNINFNEISNNIIQNKNINNFQGINNKEYIVSNTSKTNNEYNNMNNLCHNLNQININDLSFPQNNFNQFNFLKTNEYNWHKNNNNLELYKIININNLFNNECLEAKNEINNNQSYNPYFSLNNNQLIGNYNFFSQNKNQENPLFNTYNKVNNNNYINNFININIPMIQNNYNQLFSINEMNNNILNNKINNNIFNNNISNNINENKNYFFNNNNNRVNDKNNSYNNIKDSNMHYNKEEILFNNQIKKRDNQKKNYKKSMDLFSINNSKINNSKKYHSNKNVNSFNPDKNILSNKRKIFNPIPDSEKEKNIINLLDILQCKDLRTTLMIKNIPNKYTIVSFLDEINEYFKNTYDIFYLPIDYINKCNLGFAFINFVEPLHIILFYELYKGKKWKKFNSEKICELLYAKLQGKKELISHFEKGKVLSFDNEDKRPLILNTPNPLPKINIPYYYLNIFIKLYPKIPYEIKELKNNNDKNDYSLKQIFSINGNFKNN